MMRCWYALPVELVWKEDAMGTYFNPPQDLVDGNIGTEIPASSGTGDIHARWLHYLAIAQSQGGHLYAVVDTGMFLAAAHCDAEVDFSHAVSSNLSQSAVPMRYFVLSPDEHALAR